MATWYLLPESPIRVTERGAWLHGTEDLHPRVAKLFARHIVPTVEGQYLVRLGRERQLLEVADTAFFVRSMRLQLEAESQLMRVTLELSDGKTEALDPATLMQSTDHALYCQLQRYELTVPCRFMPAHYHELAWHIAEGEGGLFYLRMKDKRWPIKPYVRAPFYSSSSTKISKS